MARNFRDLLHAQWDEQRFLCVGLDTDITKIPESAQVGSVKDTIVSFNRSIVDSTKDIAGSYKLNSAFYEEQGDLGMLALQQSIEDIHELAPDTPVILDAKRADIGNTNQGYVAAAYEYLNADAITVHPYLGQEALQPFLDRTDRGVFVLCRTSNGGAGEFQDLAVGGGSGEPEVNEPLYMHVARAVHEKWNAGENCGLVVGATYPEEMKKIRSVAHDLPFLIPGIGTQGGDIQKAVACGKDSRGRGMIIAVSRAIIFASSASDYAGAARAKAGEIDSSIRAALAV